MSSLFGIRIEAEVVGCDEGALRAGGEALLQLKKGDGGLTGGVRQVVGHQREDRALQIKLLQQIRLDNSFQVEVSRVTNQ